MTAAVDNIAIKPDQRAPQPLMDTQTQLDKDLVQAADNALLWLRERHPDAQINIVEMFASTTVKEHIGSARVIRYPKFRAGANEQ